MKQRITHPGEVVYAAGVDDQNRESNATVEDDDVVPGHVLLTLSEYAGGSKLAEESLTGLYFTPEDARMLARALNHYADNV